ncbi:hypothetical protein [Sphingomonas hylomeconis]|uniref:Uncharacterized protein n=1 Tax=Sphingomonas hylomeconis TaxID=1395958 RepID=A0ABV7SRT7_9SPHN|nr:hypothetical protein [Sphingomonas hylomeconis]
MRDPHIYSDPSTVEAEGSVVHLQGPSDVDIAMTPEAALETAKRLGDAAVDAILDQAAGTQTDDIGSNCPGVEKR